MFLLVLIYLIAALVGIYQLMKLYKGKKKWRVFFLLLFLFYLPLGWDVILGRAYFHYLCNKDGGIHIYEAVELGPEYWYRNGKPKFYTNGDFDGHAFNGQYKGMTSSKRNFNKLLNIGRNTYQIIDQSKSNLLGEWIRYNYFGGWLAHAQPFHVSGISCHVYSDTPDNPLALNVGNATHQKFTSYIFLREKTNKVKEK